MSNAPTIVDTHIHLWNLRDNPWYPELMDATRRPASANISRIDELGRNYLLEDYLADAVPNGVGRFVHVSAAQGGANQLAELEWLEEIAARTGMPHALIGQIEPRDDIADIARSLAVQMRSPRVRGVRITFNLDPDTDKAVEIVARIADAGCLLEIVTQPRNAAGFARLLERFPALTVIVEHAGWPTHPDDPSHFHDWRRGMAQLAERENTLCKLSGLPMALRSCAADVMRPWVEASLDIFGDKRCMFGSNFPVDRLFGDYKSLIGGYREIVAGRGAACEHDLFGGNAERVYDL